MKRALLILLLASICAGCTSLVKAPVVTVRDLNVISLDTAGAGMELYLTVQNPNSYDVKLLGYSYDLKVLALPLATGGAREEVSFPAEAETDLRIPVRVSFGNLLEILKRMPDPDRIPYALSAGLDLETPVGQMTVPINRAGTYAVPQKFRPGAILNRIGDFFNQNR